MDMAECVLSPSVATQTYHDLADRSSANPILKPGNTGANFPGAEVTCVINPGVFIWQSEPHLIVRIAERMPQTPGEISTLVADRRASGGARIVAFDHADPHLVYEDSRAFTYNGKTYLTTLSHLRIMRLINGEYAVPADTIATLTGEGDHETYGIEDCRVVRIRDTYILTYTAVSEYGVGIGLRTTQDWQTFVHHGIVMPCHNKDMAVFDELIDGKFACLHRPIGIDLGGPYIWYAESPDLKHWGNHRCIAMTRPERWDSERIGAGCAPIRTEMGWLAIYHGADHQSRYCLGALLLDLDHP